MLKVSGRGHAAGQGGREDLQERLPGGDDVAVCDGVKCTGAPRSCGRESEA